MGSNYTEQDTERARQAEPSSAGMATQQLSNVPAARAATTPRRNNLAALALITIGVLMLLGRIAPMQFEFEGGLVLLTIASCFLFFSFWKRSYGRMIPGAIRAGLCAGVTFADVTRGASGLWGLALGSLAVSFLARGVVSHQTAW